MFGGVLESMVGGSWGCSGGICGYVGSLLFSKNKEHMKNTSDQTYSGLVSVLEGVLQFST